MAAIFHDIGYPQAYYMTTNKHIMDYLANLYHLNSGSGNIRSIYSLLQNSLLFRVVPFDEIEKRYNKEKPEHGTLSAIVFLLHFYENGVIFRLEPYKVAAVELAALAIYNHTNKYGVISEKGMLDAYRPCFALNPISYLLRICDDLQEWDRIYFVISNKSNPLFCNRCRTPIIRKFIASNGVQHAKYECNCRKAVEQVEQPTCFSQAFDGESKFPYRRIYNVSVCDQLELDANDNNKKLLIKLNYDLYKLLHIAYLDPMYAKFRIEELNSLKRLFENQGNIPKIYLDYFVTSNPVHIKVMMIGTYLNGKPGFQTKLDEVYNSGGGYPDKLNQIFRDGLTAINPLLDRFCIHENLCKECAYCENFIHALPAMEYSMGDSTGFGYVSSCQNELNRRTLSWIVLNDYSLLETDDESMKTLINMNKNLSEMKEKKELLYPNLQKTVQKYKSESASIFFDKDKITIEKCANELTKRCPSGRLRKYLEKAVGVYLWLYICQEFFKRSNMEKKEDVEKTILDIGKRMSEEYSKYPELQCMVEDCFLQFSRMYTKIEGKESYPSAYYQQYANGKRKQFLYGGWEDESEEYYYTAVLRYIDSEQYVPFLERDAKSFYLDAYTDLYLFQLIHKEIQKEYNKNKESSTQ